MRPTWTIRVQTALVIALFLGSVATVVFSAFQTLLSPQRELEVRDRLREASQHMAREAGEVESLPKERGAALDRLSERLGTISQQVLAKYPEVEGGFYVDAGVDAFAGYGFPTGAPGPHRKGPRRPGGDDPPPKEKPFILLQAQHSLSLDPGDFQFDVRTVGPSRVAILTEPVGSDRPARMATWAMYRVVSPESQEKQLRRYQVSTGLALGGIALAVILTLNLGRSLKGQRIEQERLREELRRTEHLAALGKMLAGVAHEVRNPLAGIRSTVQLWERLPDQARSKDTAQAVIQAVDRLNEIVSRLLYFARIDKADRHPVDLNVALGETLNLMDAQAANQSVLIERVLAPNLPTVSGSPTALRQVFLNLATNALQAMQNGGRLNCSTSYDAGKHMAQIRFSDTGPGISAEDQKHLFEPFFTTRPEGTGLGLALCREIVLQHGGQIAFEEGNPGAVFRVLLPVAPRMS